MLGELTATFTTGYNPSTHRSMLDVTVDNKDSPQLVSLHLRHAETAQLGEEAYIYLTSDLCPVAALIPYIAVCFD